MATNINRLHKQSMSYQERLAQKVTRGIGTLACAYLFAILAFVALPQAIQSGSLTVLVNWLSSNFLQLILLPLIMVSQNLESRHNELRADHDFAIDTKAEKEISRLHKKLDILLSKI